MEKTCMRDVFYLRKIFDACAITLEKISFMRFNPTFFCLICRMIFTRALKIGTFYRAFVFCSGQSDVKTSGPNQTIYRLRNMPLHVERIVGISKCQANSKLIHVIKQVDIYWRVTQVEARKLTIYQIYFVDVNLISYQQI